MVLCATQHACQSNKGRWRVVSYRHVHSLPLDGRERWRSKPGTKRRAPSPHETVGVLRCLQRADGGVSVAKGGLLVAPNLLCLPSRTRKSTFSQRVKYGCQVH